jgi:hypothetical protein
MRIPTRLAAAALVAATLPVLATAPAHAGDDNEVIRTGSCSGSADWKIKAKPDDGRLEVEAEIDSNRNGQQWRWRLKRDGNLLARGTSTTRGPSGSFEVERKVSNTRGKDVFKFRARHNGQVCVARVTI